MMRQRMVSGGISSLTLTPQSDYFVKLIFEKLSCYMKTTNLPKEKYDSKQELKLHLATSVIPTDRETFGNIMILLHPEAQI